MKNFCLFDIDMTLHCVLTQFNCHKTPLFVFFEQPRYHLAENVTTLMLGELLLKTGPSIWQQLSRKWNRLQRLSKNVVEIFSQINQISKVH